ncbi:MAG: hypothetical protein EHM49_08065 [Deltaproteobacteria bacterium]|nr:MAG: hypothetical protein EHM49_08065 [Deltaproteobacteria bacterium]
MDLPSLPKARGNKELKKYLLGARLTQRQAILAKCADCMGYYLDGRLDCEIEDCPLYPFMPYRIEAQKSSKATSEAPQKQNRPLIEEVSP